METWTEVFVMALVMAIPLVAIIGGFTRGIIRSHHRHKLLELAQKERIAAIERGIDPSKLPPIALPQEMFQKSNGVRFEQKQLRRSQLLMIWGLIVSGFGLAIGPVIMYEGSEPGAWISGLVFLMIGIALMISSRVVRPDPEDVRREKELWEKKEAKQAGIE